MWPTLQGTEVTVLRPVKADTDALGNPTYGTPARETVANVLVQPGATADHGTGRPDGATVALTLHFPKTYAGRLRGCLVEVGGAWAGTYRVVGDPLPYTDALTPGAWNRPVEVEVADG